MAIPKFDEFFSPILQYLNTSGSPVTRKTIIEDVKISMNFTPEECSIRTSGDNAFKVNDRIEWSLTYLKQAGLIENTNRAVYQITDFGKSFLGEYPSFYLKELKEYTPFLSNRKTKNVSIENESTEEQENNNDVILATADYYESVEFDILDRLKNMGNHSVDKGTKFEDICLNLLETMGYGNKERTGGAGDRGVDGFLTTDKFGFERIGVQCKCYTDGNINDDQITKFAHGLKNVNGLNKGIFITTTDFIPSAKKVVEELKDIKIILINGSKLARYMREYQIGVQVIETNYVYDIIIGE